MTWLGCQRISCAPHVPRCCRQACSQNRPARTCYAFENIWQTAAQFRCIIRTFIRCKINSCSKWVTILLSYVGSPYAVCQPLDCIIICRVKSAWQTAIQLHQRAWVDNVRHHLGHSHSTGTQVLWVCQTPSLSIGVHNGPAVWYKYDSAETTAVKAKASDYGVSR